MNVHVQFRFSRGGPGEEATIHPAVGPGGEFAGAPLEVGGKVLVFADEERTKDTLARVRDWVRAQGHEIRSVRHVRD